MTKFLLFEAFVYFWHRWNNSLFLTRRWCYSVCISLRLNYACSLGNPNVFRIAELKSQLLYNLSFNFHSLFFQHRCKPDSGSHVCSCSSKKRSGRSGSETTSVQWSLCVSGRKWVHHAVYILSYVSIKMKLTAKNV